MVHLNQILNPKTQQKEKITFSEHRPSLSVESSKNELPSIPNEIWFMILKKININDFLNVKMVCKKFYNICKLIKINNLSIKCEKTKRCLYDYFPFTTDQIHSTSSLLWTDSIGIIQSPSIESMLSGVKKLSIDRLVAMSESRWNKINAFFQKLIQLESLSINSMHLYKNKTLKLNNLRFLLLDYQFNGTLMIDAPKLSHCRTVDWNNMILIDPKTVTHLHVKIFSYFFLMNFINLEYLYIEDSIKNFTSVLNRFRKLKEIRSEFTSRFILSNQLEEKNRLFNFNLKLFYSGYEIRFQDDIQIFFGKDDDDYTSLIDYNNYGELFDVVGHIKKINYNDLFEHFNGTPTDFFEKCIGIKIVEVKSRILNLNDFIQFLRKCKLISELNLENSGLGQDFFNEIPVNCPSIEKLKISKTKAVDLSFITELTYLRKFSIDQEISADLVEYAKKNSKFSSVTYLSKGKLVDKKFDRNSRRDKYEFKESLDYQIIRFLSISGFLSFIYYIISSIYSLF